MDGAIRHRHLSPALRALPSDRLRSGPPAGVKALIYNWLWRGIADGRMEAGAQISETELEQLFGVSRTVTRSVLEHMAMEGYVDITPHQTSRVHEPSPKEARDVFEVLHATMTHIVRELSAPTRTLPLRQRRLIEMHLNAQTQVDEDASAAHLLGIEYLILLAAIHDVPAFTELTTRAVLVKTLSLRVYGQFPSPAWYTAFQHGLTDAILARRQDAALAEFHQRHAHIRATLRFDDVGEDDEDEPVAVLAQRRQSAPRRAQQR
ncbi:MAG: GntR family transcriptional regulator [Nevskiaceae bacterium]|jgi:DNA-binding GntR family transcriptional regulator|nr:GntR family transcriptional regulator [Nevskiaceae bacterium]